MIVPSVLQQHNRFDDFKKIIVGNTELTVNGYILNLEETENKHREESKTKSRLKKPMVPLPPKTGKSKLSGV